MAEEDKIKYSDIIQPDDSIERLIGQLGEFTKQYETTVNAIRAGADRIVHSIKAASGATSNGRKAIDDASLAASRLERAHQELRLALSDTGKQIAWLKAQTSDANKSTVEQQRYIQQLTTSYDRLKSDLKQSVQLFKSLSAAERADSEMGQQLLNDIINLKNQIKELDAQMRPHIETVSELERAEQRLAFLQSAEGQRLLDIKAKIQEVTNARRQNKAAIDPIVQAQEKLAYAQSDENAQLKLLTAQTKEANEITRLTAIVNNSATGSYNQLSAQYQLNKIKLNAMSAEERSATEAGKELEEQTLRIYKQMIHLQEATGNHKLSVGNYIKAWDGLGFSVSQVVREIPSLTMGFNTFFLAISNNIPIVIDELNRVREKNKLLRAEGRQTQNVGKTIASSIFSWQTALVLLLTVLSQYGEEIIEWITKTNRAKDSAELMAEAMTNIADELASSSQFGENIAQYKKLRDAWNDLSNDMERNDWIEANKDKLFDLSLAVNDVNDAHSLFVERTDEVIKAFKLRAKAAAAYELAVQRYKEGFAKEEEAAARLKDPTITDKLTGIMLGQILGTTPSSSIPFTDDWNNAVAAGAGLSAFIHATDISEEAKAEFQNAQQYYDLYSSLSEQASELLGDLDIDDETKKQRDLTDSIFRMVLQVRRKYEKSLTDVIEDEFIKRHEQVKDEANREVRELQETYRKNEKLLRGNNLATEQRNKITNAQAEITKAISNIYTDMWNKIEDINKEHSLRILKTAKNDIQARLDVAKEGSEEELNLKLELLEAEKKIALAENSMLRPADRMMPADIEAKYNKQKSDLQLDFRIVGYENEIEKIQTLQENATKNSAEELEYKLRILEIEKQITIERNRALPENLRQDENAIVANYDKKINLETGAAEMSIFDDIQSYNEATFNATKQTELEIIKFKLEQEIARWQKQIELAEAGSLDWSQVQIDAAKETVKRLNRELEESTSFVSRWDDLGLEGALLERMGLDDEQISAVKDAYSTMSEAIIECLQSIYDAEVELAEKEVELAEERVNAAQSALDAEIEARNNGYANNVATAKKELQLQKQNQLEKQRLLEEAKRKQQAVDTVMQTSNLITGVSAIWATSMKLGPIAGPILAAITTATMFGAFIASKIKAAEATKASQAYGEGGFEILEGGSHASGDDIDLNTKNSRGKNMRAEGGEALAIINRRSTRRYRKQLPHVIKALNNGTFEDKYMRAFETGDALQQCYFNASSDVNLSTIESELAEIRKQSTRRIYTTADGTTVIIDKNVKRYIK